MYEKQCKKTNGQTLKKCMLFLECDIITKKKKKKDCVDRWITPTIAIWYVSHCESDLLSSFQREEVLF